MVTIVNGKLLQLSLKQSNKPKNVCSHSKKIPNFFYIKYINYLFVCVYKCMCIYTQTQKNILFYIAYINILYLN